MALESRACAATTGVREEDSGRVGGKLHITVRRRSDGRIRLQLCEECRLYHCPFCHPSVYKPKGDYAIVWTHIEIHRMRALKHGDFDIHVCQLKCRQERHYHCPYCFKTIMTRKTFENHMDNCAGAQNSAAQNSAALKAAAPPSTLAQPAPVAGQCAILLVNVTPPLQQTIVMGKIPAPPDPLATPKCTSGITTAQLKSTSEQPSAQLKSLADTCPSLSVLPENPNVTTDQCSVKTHLPGTPKSTSDQSTVWQKSSSGQCPVPPDHPGEPKSDQPAAVPDLPVQPTNPVAHPSSLATSPLKQKGQMFSTGQRKIKCPLCNLYLIPKNLRIHNLRKHLISERNITAKDHLRSECIDAHNGVYAVAKAYKATAVPLHVLKKKSEGTLDMCEEDRCKGISDFRRRSSLPESQCPHLRSVDFCLTRTSTIDLRPELLEELMAKRMIGKDMVAKCLNHREQASINKSPLVALVDLGGSHCLYLSVFEPQVSQYSKLGRLFVTFNLKKGLWHCVCSRGRIPCLHRCLAKWYLLQTKKELLFSNGKLGTPMSLSELMDNSPAETFTETAGGTAVQLKQMAEYIYNHKKLPSLFPEGIIQLEPVIHFPMHLVPAETVCQVCTGQVPLTEPALITNKARVITLTGVTEDNATFVKKCPDCQMIYRYQEWTEGLHNYNNHIILSLQLIMLLQNSIKLNAADGAMEVLERTVGVKSPFGIEVLQAYLHFEALTSHDCKSKVMMELHKKRIFNMAGIETTDMPESFMKEDTTEVFWDAACRKILASSLEARSSGYTASLDDNLKEAAVSTDTTTFTRPGRERMSKEKTEECHKAVARFLVKGLHPVSTVESEAFREMTEMLNPKYHLPSKDYLMKKLIPSWYSSEKKHVIQQLQQVSKAALTCDCWTSASHILYRTVSLHFIVKGRMMQRVLCTKQVYTTQKDTVVAKQIGATLKEFGLGGKVVALTVDNAFTMDRTIKKLHFRKLTCFAQILSVSAQKVYTSNSVASWASNIRAAVVWMNCSSTAQTVLQEKQQLLNLPQHTLVLDVEAHWNTLYLMLERFVEQYAAIQSTTTDPRVRPSVENKRLETISGEDLRKAEEFVRTMKPLYTSALCVSADKRPSCSQIFPILKKLEVHFETQCEDSLFTATLKERIWDDLSTCYQDGDTWRFLQESSAMDPRFKNSIKSEEIWHRVENAAIRATTETERYLYSLLKQVVSNTALGELRDVEEEDDEDLDEAQFPKRQRLTALEELFEEEDRALKSNAVVEKTLSIPERVQQEIKLYRKLPAVPTSQDALTWWWERRTSLPLLFQLSNSYLCVQASSTPCERVFLTAGETISQERSQVRPELADVQIFLQKNCEHKEN